MNRCSFWSLHGGTFRLVADKCESWSDITLALGASAEALSPLHPWSSATFGFEGSACSSGKAEETIKLGSLDTTIVADVGAEFPLGSVCVVLPLGQLYSSFNIKWVFITTVVIFGVGSAICGAAPSMSALIVGRVIAGERSFYMALIGSSWGVGATLGPVIGGAFATSPATWRGAFYINFAIFALSTPAYVFYLPSIYPSQGVSVRTRFARLALIGFLLGAGSWVTFLLAISMTIDAFVVFGATLVAYIFQQAFAIFTTKNHHAFPAHLLRERTQILLYIQTSAGITTLNVAIALKAAVRLLPFVIVAISVNLASGYFLSAIKIYMLIYIIGGIFLTIGGALLTVYLKPSTPPGTLYGLCVIIAIGCGLAMLTGYLIASLTTKPENAGAAWSMQNVSQLGAVKNLRSVLASQNISEQDIESAVAGVRSKVLEQLQGPLREEVILALVKAMQKVFVLISMAGDVMLLAALCMKREKLFGVAVVSAA
ncbi:MFS general substrate transporter [Tothia fuscella]|uniref:MFS general substrate transporter n=1 Tax=Tothia fuscella TaxID=1048955 RepID=A0A9P4U3R7_9PEZI|nr:MFS general substrate transporter [Tothia fuscella]